MKPNNRLATLRVMSFTDVMISEIHTKDEKEEGWQGEGAGQNKT